MKAPALALAVSAVLALAGCSTGGGSDSAGPSASATATPSATPYLPVPAGVTLTPPGSQLSVGDAASVAYEPRQDQVGALDITVTALETTKIEAFSAWQLSDAQKASTPYYVRATIENVGETDLGGRPVPLYVVNENDVLLEATPFASSFKPCPSTPFPEKFGPGDSADVCLVYLAPDRGELEAVSFRPEETFNPITWTGEVVKYQPPKPEKKPKDSKKSKNG
ncbi:hypothetical protein [Nocardioides sp. SR21]|uniref:hypothetical protein n=1 Tax=Nocardioides sp. SR21 TaxID=2919501 RepID=UPI001FA9A00C|nr:hypothetical protein [Nocardioides sp. SR21]